MERYKNGTNAKIKFNRLSDDEMKKLGFWDGYKHDLNRWVKVEEIPGMQDVSFNVEIPKENSDAELNINVIDEAFCQPYDWQYYMYRAMENGITIPKRLVIVKDYCIKRMHELTDAGLLYGWEEGDYI